MIVAAVQLTSTDDRAHNLREAVCWIEEAHRRGARFVALPENVDFIGPEAEKVAGAEPLDGPTFQRFAERARALGIWILAGTVAECASPGRIFNTSVLYGPTGAPAAVYRKLHLFDVDLADGSRYRESRIVEPGSEVVLADTAIGKIGLTICYDLRFPELYRTLATRGAELLTVPSAFTVHTGKDHWEVLLRARAIENTAWVIAPAQVGHHGGGRTTYGHSMIVDPWGTVVARCPDGPGLCLAQLDPDRLARVRRELPSLSHVRLVGDRLSGRSGGSASGPPSR